MWSVPWSFTYMSDIGKQKIRVDIMERINQYFTKDSVYKIRLHFEDGNVLEGFYTEPILLNWLAKRVKE